MKNCILIIIFSLLFVLSFGQIQKVEVRFIGNSGLYLTDGNLNVYIDFPYKSGAYGYMTYDPNLLDSIQDYSIFLFTHGHADHFSRKLFKRTNQKLFGPWPVRFLLSKKRKLRIEKINDSLDNFSMKVIKTKHKYCLQHFSYLIEWNNKRIYISGDTEKADTISTLKNLDIVFAPYWLILDSYKRELQIDTKKYILVHHKSVANIKNENPKVIVPSQNQTFIIE